MIGGSVTPAGRSSCESAKVVEHGTDTRQKGHLVWRFVFVHMKGGGACEQEQREESLID